MHTRQRKMGGGRCSSYSKLAHGSLVKNIHIPMHISSRYNEFLLLCSNRQTESDHNFSSVASKFNNSTATLTVQAHSATRLITISAVCWADTFDGGCRWFLEFFEPRVKLIYQFAICTCGSWTHAWIGRLSHATVRGNCSIGLDTRTQNSGLWTLEETCGIEERPKCGGE